MEDSAIVDLYWQRSDRAIAETDRKYGRYCQTIAFNICGTREDAEECVSDTWFRAWNLMPDQRPRGLTAFLGCITRNFAINGVKERNRLKRGGGETSLALEELEEGLPGPGEQEKKVFVLRYFYLVPVAEIAERLRFSQSKTKSMLLRTRTRLRRFLQEEGLC